MVHLLIDFGLYTADRYKCKKTSISKDIEVDKSYFSIDLSSVGVRIKCVLTLFQAPTVFGSPVVDYHIHTLLSRGFFIFLFFLLRIFFSTPICICSAPSFMLSGLLCFCHGRFHLLHIFFYIRYTVRSMLCYDPYDCRSHNCTV